METRTHCTARSARYDKIASRFSDILLAGLVPPPAAFFIGRFYCPPPSWRRRGWDDVSSDKSIFRGMQILRSRPGRKGEGGAKRRREEGVLYGHRENDRPPHSPLRNDGAVDRSDEKRALRCSAIYRLPGCLPLCRGQTDRAELDLHTAAADIKKLSEEKHACCDLTTSVSVPVLPPFLLTTGAEISTRYFFAASSSL